MISTNLLNHSVKRGATLLGAVGLGAIAFLGMPEAAKAANVLLGTDYIQTPAGGTTFNFGGSIGNVDFKGLPLNQVVVNGLTIKNLGMTDTIVQRKADAIFDDNNDGILERTTSNPIDIEFTAVSLISIAPVNLGGFNYNIEVTLDDRDLDMDEKIDKPSTGTMQITHNSQINATGDTVFNDSGTYQGTFTSGFTLNFKAKFIALDSGPAIPTDFRSLYLNVIAGNPGQWTHNVTDENPVLQVGLVGNQYANCHTATGDPSSAPPCNAGDFFIVGEVPHQAPDDPFKHTVKIPECPGGNCIVQAQVVPEPLTILGTGVVLGAIPALKKEYAKRKKKKDGDA